MDIRNILSSLLPNNQPNAAHKAHSLLPNNQPNAAHKACSLLPNNQPNAAHKAHSSQFIASKQHNF
jgi:hypothetical protein